MKLLNKGVDLQIGVLLLVNNNFQMEEQLY